MHRFVYAPHVTGRRGRGAAGRRMRSGRGCGLGSARAFSALSSAHTACWKRRGGAGKRSLLPLSPSRSVPLCCSVRRRSSCSGAGQPWSSVVLEELLVPGFPRPCEWLWFPSGVPAALVCFVFLFFPKAKKFFSSTW